MPQGMVTLHLQMYIWTERSESGGAAACCCRTGLYTIRFTGSVFLMLLILQETTHFSCWVKAEVVCSGPICVHWQVPSDIPCLNATRVVVAFLIVMATVGKRLKYTFPARLKYVMLLHLQDCEVFLPGPLAALFIHGLQRCQIYTGPVAGAAFIEGEWQVFCCALRG